MKRELKALKDLFSKKPKGAIIFITTNCNFRCKTCFYWRSLGKGDLAINDFKKVLNNLPKELEDVSLSGGEPFIRKDLPEIIKLLSDRGVKSIGIPTNGSLKEIPEITKRILTENPNLSLLIAMSLDGFENTNDETRMKGGFKKALATLKELRDLKKSYPNLKLQITTTITNKNYQELPEFIEFVKKLDVDNHAFDWIRGAHQGILTLPPLNKTKEIDKLRKQAFDYYNNKKGFIQRVYSNTKNMKVFKTQEKVLFGKKWDYSCLAGKVNFVVEANGDLKICEFLPSLGNLKEKSYAELINSKQAKETFRKIKNHECDCTHICFVSSSLSHSPRAILTSFFLKKDQ